MKSSSAIYLLGGTFFMAAGYGATFLISVYLLSQGKSDSDVGITLGFALVGTLIGVPLVGWLSGTINAARFTVLAALAMASGFILLGTINEVPENITFLAVALIGLGWGVFYISGPMALSERISDAQRGSWFTCFSAFQMAGICMTPILMNTIMKNLSFDVKTTYLTVGVTALFASLLFFIFERKEPSSKNQTKLRSWVRNIVMIKSSAAIKPIIMVGLGGGIFSAIMAFQVFLTEDSESKAENFYAVHAITVVCARILLARHLTKIKRERLIPGLMLCLIIGIFCLLGIHQHPVFHILSAMLTGLGYGLIYPVIQTWAINSSDDKHRHAVMTWFVMAYFIGIFGFPALGEWIFAVAGKNAFICVVAMLACLELLVAIIPQATGRENTRVEQ